MNVLLLISGGISPGMESLLAHNVRFAVQDIQRYFETQAIICLWDDQASLEFARLVKRGIPNVSVHHYKKNEEYSDQFIQYMPYRLTYEEKPAAISFGYQFFLMHKCWKHSSTPERDHNLIIRMRPDLIIPKLDQLLKAAQKMDGSTSKTLISESDLLSPDHQVSDKLFIANAAAAKEIFRLYQRSACDIPFNWSPQWKQRYIGERLLKTVCKETSINVEYVSTKASLFRKSGRSKLRFYCYWLSKMWDNISS